MGAKLCKIEKDAKFIQYSLNLLRISLTIVMQIYTFAIVTVHICTVTADVYITILLIFSLSSILFPHILSLVSLSLSLVFSTWRRSWRPNHQQPLAPPNHHQHHHNLALPTSITTTHFNGWNPNTKSTQPSKINLKLNSKSIQTRRKTHHEPNLKSTQTHQKTHPKPNSKSIQTKNKSKPNPMKTLYKNPLEKLHSHHRSYCWSTLELQLLSSNPPPLTLLPFSSDLLTFMCESLWVWDMREAESWGRMERLERKRDADWIMLIK